MNDLNEPKHDIHTTSFPCHEQGVRLYVRTEKAIHLHERTCKKCGQLWTFATDRERYGKGWATAISFKLGRPTVPAVHEVLMGREDGWVSDETFERQRFKKQFAGR